MKNCGKIPKTLMDLLKNVSKKCYNMAWEFLQKGF